MNAKPARGLDDMNTVADALAWALRRIETARLGEGEYFARAKQILERSQADREAMNGPQMTDAARDVLAERQRQVSVEGWTPKHDDEHVTGAMARAAVRRG